MLKRLRSYHYEGAYVYLPVAAPGIPDLIPIPAHGRVSHISLQCASCHVFRGVKKRLSCALVVGG